MKIVLNMMLVLGTLMLVGCGGGGGDTPIANGEDNTNLTQAYQNKKLPVIKDNAIPDVLLANSSSSKKLVRQSKEVGEISFGFTTLKTKAKFFYKKQLEMNIEIGYMDSIWNQIEIYCQEKKVCDISGGKIVFTYTEALYNRDMVLIKGYEEITGDTNTYSEYEEGLKSVIGEKLELLSAKLIIDEVAEYKYVLHTVQLENQEENPNIERSIVKWNDDNGNYFVREELEGSGGDVNYNQFIYTERDEEVTNKFTSNNQGFYDESLEFIEKDGKIYFVQDEPDDDDLVSFYAEGYLDDNGGSMTVVGAGQTYYETFDRDGDILTTISCNEALIDPKSISDTDSCSIQDPGIIKEILLKNIYSLAQPFWGENDFAPTSGAEHHTMLKFDENDSMLAVVDCSTFIADYEIGEYGISFQNIKKTISPDLKCLYPQIQSNFEQVLKHGLPFMHAVDDPIKGNSHFNTLFGFFPNLDNVSRTDFDLDKFYEKLNVGEYVDSPLMNSVFEIKSVHEYAHQENGQGYLLMSSPQIKVENGKMIIDLIDATFEAEIEVVDPTHIKFVNINRENKNDITYPDDVNNTCVEENLGTEDECMEDPYIDSTNSDKIFTSIIEKFLSETVEVHSSVTFVGTELVFGGWEE